MVSFSAPRTSCKIKNDNDTEKDQTLVAKTSPFV